jgi:hypothetical protein
LKSLGCEIDDFVQSCVFNGLMSVSFRRVSPFRAPGENGGSAESPAPALRTP